jgi:YegS/Rv2252/BmrU family lipid kinase
MTHLFIINPAAGSRDRTADYTDKIKAAFAGRTDDYRIEISAGPGECTRIAREAAQSGENYRIYACGGDGTLNEVVQGAAGFDNVAITVYSGGSGNDFVKIFDDPKAFFEIDRLLDAETATFDLIKCNNDYSINICSVGLDARIGVDVANYKRIPLLSGFRAYVASTLVNIFRSIAEHYVVEINGEVIDADKTFVCMCNGRYYGGGFNPVPEADPSDGLMDVLLVDRVSLLQIPGIIGKYKDGRYKEIKNLVRHVLTDRVKIVCDKETAIQMDGELRRAKEFTFRIADEKINFFYPKGLVWSKKEAVHTK